MYIYICIHIHEHPTKTSARCSHDLRSHKKLQAIVGAHKRFGPLLTHIIYIYIYVYMYMSIYTYISPSRGEIRSLIVGRFALFFWWRSADL